jgi:tRNA A37 threonylcarbamoyladenosine dehydratase
VAESNINRQVQAVGATVGMAKTEALRRRIADIHPGCEVSCVEDFVEPGNWPALLPAPVHGLIDACDQSRAKFTLAAWALAQRLPFVTVGAAGGKQRAQDVEVDDLGLLTHDPLLAALRQRLRKAHGAPRTGTIGVACVFSREAVAPPDPTCSVEGGGDGSLNCHGYGSSVVVTATFGMVAAGEALRRVLAARQNGG